MFTFGRLGVHLMVSPETTHRSHCHPVERFPCPIPWTLQRGVGGGYPVSCAAHGGSQPDNGVESRWTRCSHLARDTSQAFRVRSSEALKNGAGCYPLKCGRVGCRFPEGQNPLQLDSPYHVISQARHLRDTPSLHRAFQGHAAHLAERPTRLSPNGSLPPW